MANISLMPRTESNGTADAPPPTVLTRTISVPPGPPWEQARAANLEARHGAPLPISELVFQIRRLDSWAPGRAVRYAVFYVRERELTARFSTIVEVDGRPLAVEFRPAGDRAEQVRLLTQGAVFVVVLISIVAGSVLVGHQVRAAADVRLEAAERLAATRLRQAKVVQKQLDEQRRLEIAVGSSDPVTQVLADLTWASAQRAPEARLAAVHWEHGLLAVETRSEVAPFVDANGLRAAGRIRPGVWLWGAQPPRWPDRAAAGRDLGARP